MRLFLAVSLPQPVCAALDTTMDELRRRGVSGSFTRRENLHLTLAFLGETHRVKCLTELLSRLKAAPFELTIQGLGQFGDTWWAGAAPNPQLQELVYRLRSELSAAGFPVDSRRFCAHITLARRVRAVQGAFPAFAPLTFTVDRITLMHSHRVDGLLTYTPVWEQTLIGPQNPTKKK